MRYTQHFTCQTSGLPTNAPNLMHEIRHDLKVSQCTQIVNMIQLYRFPKRNSLRTQRIAVIAPLSDTEKGRSNEVIHECILSWDGQHSDGIASLVNSTGSLPGKVWGIYPVQRRYEAGGVYLHTWQFARKESGPGTEGLNTGTSLLIPLWDGKQSLGTKDTSQYFPCIRASRCNQ